MIPRLALTCALLSVLSFGGGGAIVPQMYDDFVTRLHWASSADFARYFALSQLAPGPMLNIGVLVGYAQAGPLGAVVACAALFVPSGLIMYAVGRAWGRAHDQPWRARLARGLTPVVVGLFWASAAAVAPGAIDGPLTALLALAATGVALWTPLNQALIILGAGAVAVAVFR